VSYLEVHEAGAVRLVPLTEATLAIGRSPTNTVTIDSKRVSRLHAVLERFPPGWSIRDLGSTNGTTVNGAPLRQTRHLRDGDRIEIGGVRLLFHAPEDSQTQTVAADPVPPPPPLTRRERDVLAELCAPHTVGGAPFPEPPSVRELAARLGLSESGVKKHLTNLYDKFGLHTNDERRRHHLATEAVRRGVTGGG